MAPTNRTLRHSPEGRARLGRRGKGPWRFEGTRSRDTPIVDAIGPAAGWDGFQKGGPCPRLTGRSSVHSRRTGVRACSTRVGEQAAPAVVTGGDRHGNGIS